MWVGARKSYVPFDHHKWMGKRLCNLLFFQLLTGWVEKCSQRKLWTAFLHQNPASLVPRCHFLMIRQDLFCTHVSQFRFDLVISFSEIDSTCLGCIPHDWIISGIITACIVDPEPYLSVLGECRMLMQIISMFISRRQEMQKCP
jgi:hypothetical protein